MITSYRICQALFFVIDMVQMVCLFVCTVTVASPVGATLKGTFVNTIVRSTGLQINRMNRHH